VTFADATLRARCAQIIGTDSTAAACEQQASRIFRGHANFEVHTLASRNAYETARYKNLKIFDFN
jgi:hypothetical protein